MALLIDESIPQSTKDKALWASRILEDWITWARPNAELSYRTILDEHASVLTMNSAELDILLSNFIVQARKQNGDEYPGKTKHEIITCLQKFMEMNCRKVKLIDVKTFPKLYYALDVSMKEAARQGLGMNRKTAEAISKDQEESLWQKQVLGVDTGKRLLRAIFYIIGVYFGIRGGREHRKLTSQNFSIHTDVDGHEYVQYKESVSKTNQGGIKHRKLDSHTSTAYANSDDSSRCPVAIFRKYLSQCHAESLKTAFYLKPLEKPTTKLWFGKQPIGHNILAGMVKDIMEEAGFQGNYTNHSLRVTTVTRLFHQNVDPKLITNQTGHRSNAVDGYKRISNEQRRSVSAMLSADQDDHNVVPKGKSDKGTVSVTSDSGRNIIINVYDSGAVNFNV